MIVSMIVWTDDTFGGMHRLSQSQWDALVILIAIQGVARIGKRNDLLAQQVNSQAKRRLEELGLARVKVEHLYADEYELRAICTDKALLDAMERTPKLRAAVEKAKEALRAD